MKALTTLALVDDHTLLRHSLAALIQSFDGYKVVFEADNGLDFQQQLQAHEPPDMVLLDITMPVMNGYETAQWVKEHLPQTKVLVLSMMENDAAIIRMLRAGAKGYILKDSKAAVFNQALNSVRDNGFYLNELISSRMIHYANGEEEAGLSALPVAHLTDRETTFLRLACSDKTYKEIASEMCVSPRTIDSYRDALLEKLGVTSRTGLVLYAIKNGIVVI